LSKVDIIHATPEEFDRFQAARTLVSLASQLGCRDIVLRMLVKDVTDIPSFIEELKKHFKLG